MFYLKKIIRIICIWLFIFLIAGGLNLIFKGDFPFARAILLFPFTFTGLYFTVLIVLQNKYDFDDDDCCIDYDLSCDTCLYQLTKNKCVINDDENNNDKCTSGEMWECKDQ